MVNLQHQISSNFIFIRIINNTYINFLINYRASKMIFSQFPQIIAYNIIIYIPIKYYIFSGEIIVNG